ncbi:hypothetical protein SLA2020_183180 [Shorea laevis]
MKFGTNNHWPLSHFKSSPNHIGFFKFFNFTEERHRRFLPFGSSSMSSLVNHFSPTVVMAMMATKPRIMMSIREAGFETGAYSRLAGFCFRGGKDFLELWKKKKPGGVAQDISDHHEEGEPGIYRSNNSGVVHGKVGKKSTALALEHVVGLIEKPEAQEEEDQSPGLCGLIRGIASPVPYIS